ncbi:MAG: hypothetical protein ACOYL6_18770 [Bacteriovoracaceae bacterium]
MKLSYIFLIIALNFIILAITGCSTISFPKSNVDNNQIPKIVNYQNSDSVIPFLGAPSNWIKYADGSFLHIYTNDWEDGSQVFCRNLAISYDSSKTLTKLWFTKDYSDPQQRCNNYSSQSRQQAAAWQSFANTYTETLRQENATKLGNECWSEAQCDSGQKCAKKESISGVLEMKGVCVNVLYYD